MTWRLLPALALVLSLGCSVACSVPEGSFERIESPTPEGAAQPDFLRQDEGLWLSWQGPGANLGLASWNGEGFGLAQPGFSGEGEWFLNWADFGGLAPLGNGGLLAHTRPMAGENVYAYHIGLARRGPQETSFESHGLLHEDRSPTEHGFASFAPRSDGKLGAIWLDGRATEDGGAMTVRFREFDSAGQAGPEELIDARACDCCQTALVSLGDDYFAFWRDRSGAEIRDISWSRRDADGWSSPRRIRDDGWRIAGCPVNGPSAAASETQVGVAWYSEAQERKVIRISFLEGTKFGPSTLVDEGDPRGRVQLAWSAVNGWRLIWLEGDGDGNRVLTRTIEAGKTPGPAEVLDRFGAGRSSGFPRIAAHPEGGWLAAWNHPDEGIRLARRP